MAAIRFRRVAALLLLAGCERQAPGDAPAFDPAAFNPAPACESRSFEGSLFTVCPVDTKRDTIELVDGRRLRSLAAVEAALGPRASAVKFAMNAGMYDEEGKPIGLFVAGGEQRRSLNRKEGAGNFHLMPNGVFSVDAAGKLAVTASAAFVSAVKSPVWATQSGPMLVIKGKIHPKFAPDGDSRFIRNGVGVKNGSTAYFVISEDAVSFGRFARFFRDALGCPDALYLDGTVSSLWDPAAGRQDGYSELGPMVVVFRRNGEKN